MSRRTQADAKTLRHPDQGLGGTRVVVLLGLAAAAGYAISSVLQQRAAAAEPQGSSLRITLLLRLARRPWWLAGKAVDVVATVLQAIAIHLGSVVQVEPL